MRNLRKGKKSSSFLLVAAVIFVGALHQEGHQIPSRPSITGSHHILKHSEAFRRFSPFMFPASGLRARGFELPGCTMLSSRITCFLQKLTEAIFQKQNVSLRLSLLFSLFYLSWQTACSPLSQIDGGALTSWCYVCTQPAPLHCTTVWMSLPSLVPTAHFTEKCSALGNSPW